MRTMALEVTTLDISLLSSLTQSSSLHSTVCCIIILFKGAVSRNSAKFIGNYKMPVK